MKKLLLLVLCFISVSIYSQNKWAISLEENNLIGSADETYGSNMFYGSFTFSYKVFPVFQIGVGGGFGYAQPVRYYSTNKTLDASTKKSNSLIVPLFIRAKVNFSKKPTSLFFSTDFGYINASVEGFDGKYFNPYNIFLQPTLGIDIGVGNRNKISLGLGIHPQYISYQKIEYVYSSMLKKFVYDSFKSENSVFTAVSFNLGFSF